MGNPLNKSIPKTYDTIVVGSGISGGWAAKELTEKGLKTLLVERGPQVEHIKDYPTATKPIWEFEQRLNVSIFDKSRSPSTSYYVNEANKHFFASEDKYPYRSEKPFNWIRGFQVGGRSLTWGRQCYRLSDLDFEANLKDGISIDWPIRYKDIAPWYEYVEKYIGISGKKENLSILPDGSFLPPMELNCIEQYFSEKIKGLFPERCLTIGRVANLTISHNGRGPCQFRNLCDRGCPFGGYFSSNSSTIPAAQETGNLTLLVDAIVIEILYNEKEGKASGIKVINAITKEVTEYSAKVIFLNASTIATTALLLNSKSRNFPEGLGNSSGQLGHNLMDHFIGTGAEGTYDGFNDKYYFGKRPVGFYIPRYKNVKPEDNKNNYIRGFGIQGMGARYGWKEQGKNTSGFGEDFKKQLFLPGPWSIWLGAWGETLPYYSNTVTLTENEKDQWGQHLVKIDFSYHENEEKMRIDIAESIKEMYEIAKIKTQFEYSKLYPGGSAVHEMGTARMGHDPKTSVLNKFNQMHDVKNIFITDGSCMTSSGSVNPSLTYMALTARACDYAFNQLKKGYL